MKKLSEIQSKFGQQLDPVTIELEITDTEGAKHQLKFFELSQRDATQYVQEAYGTKIYEEDSTGNIVHENLQPLFRPDGEPLVDVNGKQVMGNGTPKRRPFQDVAKEAADVVCTYLGKSTRDAVKDAAFFRDLYTKISTRQFTTLSEVLYELNCIDELLESQGNLAALPMFKAMAEARAAKASS